jgi:hypothetical protein
MNIVRRALGLLLLLALAGCANMPPPNTGSPCDAGEATWECQIKRYHDVAA